MLEYPLERASRLPTWTPGVAVMLADGATWHFPRAKAGAAELAKGGGFVCEFVISGRPCPELTEAYVTFTALLDECDKHRQRTDGPVGNFVCAAMAAALLRANYDVSHVEAMTLVWCGFEARGDGRGVAGAIRATRQAADLESVDRLAARLSRPSADN